jgi:hypothetical protein
MGKYLDTGDLSRGRADWLIVHHAATRLEKAPSSFADIPKGKALVCVIHNAPDGRRASMGGEWEGAHYVEDEIELERHGEDPTGRFKEWLLVDRAIAERLSGDLD